MADDKETLAFALQSAKETLEAQIEQVVRQYQDRHGKKPLELEVDLISGHEIVDPDAAKELVGQIHQMVDGFLAHSAVKQSGVKVHQVTAIDSDGDGRPAVNVKYEYLS